MSAEIQSASFGISLTKTSGDQIYIECGPLKAQEWRYCR